MGTYTLYGLKLQLPADVESYAREFRVIAVAKMNFWQGLTRCIEIMALWIP